MPLDVPRQRDPRALKRVSLDPTLLLPVLLGAIPTRRGREERFVSGCPERGLTVCVVSVVCAVLCCAVLGDRLV